MLPANCHLLDFPAANRVRADQSGLADFDFSCHCHWRIEERERPSREQSPGATRPNCRFLPPPGLCLAHRLRVGPFGDCPRRRLSIQNPQPVVGNCGRMAHFSYTLSNGNAADVGTSLGNFCQTLAIRKPPLQETLGQRWLISSSPLWLSIVRADE